MIMIKQEEFMGKDIQVITIDLPQYEILYKSNKEIEKIISEKLIEKLKLNNITKDTHNITYLENKRFKDFGNYKIIFKLKIIEKSKDEIYRECLEVFIDRLYNTGIKKENNLKENNVKIKRKVINIFCGTIGDYISLLPDDNFDKLCNNIMCIGCMNTKNKIRQSKHLIKY